MKFVVYILVALLSSRICFANNGRKAETIAALTAIKMNQAISQNHDFSAIFRVQGLQTNRTGEFKQFLSDIHFNPQSLAKIWFESRGTFLILKDGSKEHQIDLAYLDEHTAAIDGHVVKATHNFSEVYQSIKNAFPKAIANFWFDSLLPTANASTGEDLRGLFAGVIVADNDFNTDLKPNELTAVMLSPFEDKPGARVINFQCLKGEDLTYTTKGIQYDLPVSFSIANDTLKIKGWGCEPYPFSWNGSDGVWVPPATLTRPDQKIVCRVLTQQFAELKRCCKQAGCPQALQSYIATQNQQPKSSAPTTPTQGAGTH